MWKTEKNNQFVAPQPDRGNGNHEEVQVADPWSDGSSAARNTSATLDDLRGQPGFGVVVAASEMQTSTPAVSQPNSIGGRMAAELDQLSRRDQKVREMKDLATHRVIDLTTEQLRSILEFMA